MIRLTRVVLVLSGMAVAQQAPTNWKALKSEKATCQVAVPAEWTADKGSPTALSSNKLVSVSIFREQDAKMGPWVRCASHIN
jgi:hypothetical protein